MFAKRGSAITPLVQDTDTSVEPTLKTKFAEAGLVVVTGTNTFEIMLGGAPLARQAFLITLA